MKRVAAEALVEVFSKFSQDIVNGFAKTYDMNPDNMHVEITIERINRTYEPEVIMINGDKPISVMSIEQAAKYMLGKIKRGINA